MNERLFTDLYELTMAQAFMAEGLTGPAVFSLFVRRLPPNWNFLLAAGIAPVLRYLEQLTFDDADVAQLRALGGLSESFLDQLRGFRFAGDVYAIPEGTPVFANEPILEIVAPLPQAQIVETFVMNQIHLHTVLASNAARVVRAAAGRPVVDFGARRAHGTEAAMAAARASYLAGVQATSNVASAVADGVPVSGTMAHSYVQAHRGEREAFDSFLDAFPDATLLVDTYDTLAGVDHAIEVARRRGPLRAIRLDSGDLASLARQARQQLDAAGLQATRIVVSGELDEFRIAALVESGAPIDGFGVGSHLAVSPLVPTLDMAYKLAEYAGAPRTKLSQGKPVLPGRKQVFRRDQDGRAIGDVIARAGEELDGRPLLRQVMASGRRGPEDGESIEQSRRRAAAELARLPDRMGSLDQAEPPYPVALSAALQQLHSDTVAEVRGEPVPPAAR